MTNSEQIKEQILNLTKEYTKLVHLNKKYEKGTSPIPVSGRIFDETDVSTLVESSLDFWLTTGRFNESFEKKLSTFLNIKKVLTVNSGSSANLLAFSSLTSHLLKDRALKKGDEIISIAAGFPTTINPIIQYGLIPVFVDVKIPEYNIDENLIEQAITKKTKGIFLAHTLGNPFNLTKIMEVAKKYNLWVIEDSCDALGSTYNGQQVGTFGDVASLSFYPAHHITMGEGGAVFTNNSLIHKIAVSLRDWGRDCWCETGCDNSCKQRFNQQHGELPFGYDHKYIYSHIGYNLKITDMQAAVGVAQLAHLDGFINSRKENFNFLYENLKQFEEFLILPKAEENSDPSWFGFPISLKEKNHFKREDLLKFLNENKIGTRLLFGGNLTKQPYMKNVNYRISGKLENTDYIMNNTFWIGVYPGLNEEKLSFVIEKFEEFFSKNIKQK